MRNRPSLIAYTDGFTVDALDAFARRLEELEYDSLWVTEFTGRDPYTTAAHLLARTDRIRIATGIANVYSHDAIVAAQNRQTLAELSGGRFILGLGVSHPPMAAMHQAEWLPPLRKMREYLDTMEATRVDSPPAPEKAPIWLAANGPRLLELVAERLDGANTYLLPPTHTQGAREILGPDKRLNVVLPCCLCEDPELARKIARRALAIYMPLPAYQNEWRKCGFDESDWVDGGSDRLIDMVVAWGDEAAIRARIEAYEAAGASHIAVSAYNAAGRGPDWKLLEALAR
ncbi:MAG TPA: TIGR03620 family F420-dependent LLM class oxidoreductase [Polyangia bacterium]|nr:TIGR03620 family F420-dependent LLM class oxidoreductase [Polyangia bacterium]